MENRRAFTLGARRPLIVSGPCSAESREQMLATARELAALGSVDVLRAGIWKPRTRPGHFEGAGEPALGWLVEASRETGLPAAVEVASARHVEAALRAGVEVLWIGARTTVNPFLVQEIAEAVAGSAVTVLVKNPMHPDVALWDGAVARFVQAGVARESVGLIHRGFSLAGRGRYRNHPMWHLVFEMQERWPGMVTLCDPSHICGCRDYLQEVSQTAADLHFDGLMIESHCAPERALSDAEQQLTPAALGALLGAINWRASGSDDPAYVQQLDRCREEIDRLDAELFELLSRRMHIAERIGRVKRENNVVILQSARWSDIVERFTARAAQLGLSEEFLRSVLEAIHVESIGHQNRVMNE